MQDPQSLHKYAYCHNNPVNATDPSGVMSLPEILSSQSIQNIISTMSKFLKIYSKVRRYTNAFKRVFEIYKRLQRVATFVYQISSGFAAGMAPGPVILSALTSVFGDTIKAETLSLGIVQTLMDEAFDAMKYHAKDMFKRVQKQANLAEIGSNVFASGVFAKIMGWITAGEDLDLVLEMPSPPLPSRTFNGFWLPSIKLPKVDFGITIGLSGHGGVFMGIGVGTREPKLPDVPKLPGNYCNIARIDYWNYWSGAPKGYWPHYHAGQVNKHYPLNK